MGGNRNSVGPDFHVINVGFHCVKKQAADLNASSADCTQQFLKEVCHDKLTGTERLRNCR